MIKIDFWDLSIRFILGGSTVAGCFVLLQLIPSKSFAGLLAAFPVIMSASVIIAGHFGNSKQASDISFGASTGMLACISCIFTVILCIEYLKSWGLSIIIALSVWFLSAYLANYLISVFFKKYMGAVHE